MVHYFNLAFVERDGSNRLSLDLADGADLPIVIAELGLAQQ